ncbi:J domain-containing protein [Dyella acidiphila]|uniref:J domain-containing protein n=1 Tax=Dyella acidiphila TaxID=2775866 RepID=A0ABR9GD35_9GAMM|nr:J domain-containing protein [Dyella acidiphila]MBE1161956.1 J domain-containing protein [Dyella acidiphila]
MANEIDFLELYRQLRVSPDCSLEEFKRAYRRCVSTLHPDRRPPGHDGYIHPRSGQRLQQINVQYEAAMEFLRLHGRLPGAPPPQGVTPQRASPTPRPSPTPPPPRPTSARAPRRPQVKWLIPIALLAVVILFWGASAVNAPADGGADGATRDNDATRVEAPAPPMLSLGMSQENVRAIEGNPVEIRDDLWEYGPSWVRFDHGSVVDWYSSPLHSLKTVQAKPAQTESPVARN